jgi:hydrogenase maturation factor HypF (carbamoyltransferase family)
VSAGLRRVRVRVEGTVQGVGFRPYVHRLAGDLGLAGFVLNDAGGVVVEVEADGAAVERFLERLATEAPPLASVERVEPSEMPPLGDRGFAILASDRGAAPTAPVAPDAATCDDCLAELRDPADRRHRYPFVNPREAVLAVAADVAAGTATGVVAARFHNGLAAATARGLAEAAGREGAEAAALSGGVFQNRRLLEGVTVRLRRAGLRVLVPERLPPNDGGISYGQASAVAAAGAF